MEPPAIFTVHGEFYDVPGWVITFTQLICSLNRAERQSLLLQLVGCLLFSSAQTRNEDERDRNRERKLNA
jgi:hypothetical protein